MREARQLRFDKCRDARIEGVEMPYSLDKVKLDSHLLQQLFVMLLLCFRHF